MNVNIKDLGAGAIFVFFGLLYGSIAWFGLPIGQALNMGPGYFPVVLSGIILVLGVWIAGRGFIDTEGREPFGVVPWRGVIMLGLATIIFAACAEQLGLLPGVFVTTFIATMANSKVKPLRAAFTSLCIALFCTAVFGYGIRLPIPVIGEWLRWW
jgi:hypothetical protein